MAPQPRLVVIVGPTASGKSALAMQVAQLFNGQIICADSRTVYKGMDIGTAKPTLTEQAEIKHYCLDLVEPNQQFTAAVFQRQARAAIDEITAHGKLPILVGGTGLYVDSILFDYKFGKLADLDMRRQLEQRSVEELLSYCRKNDITLPKNTKNKRHLIRAIQTGGVNSQRDNTLRLNTVVVGLSTSKEALEARIKTRANQMLQAGLINETKQLAKKYGWQSEAMKGNVYPIMKQLIEGVVDREEALAIMVRSDMRLAKRQRTWFKRNSNIFWSESPEELIKHIEHFLSA